MSNCFDNVLKLALVATSGIVILAGTATTSGIVFFAGIDAMLVRGCACDAAVATDAVLRKNNGVALLRDAAAMVCFCKNRHASNGEVSFVTSVASPLVLESCSVTSFIAQGGGSVLSAFLLRLLAFIVSVLLVRLGGMIRL